MATAKNLDEFEDYGLAFSEDEVKEYSVEKVAEERLSWLIENYNVIYCYWRISEYGNVGSRMWSKEAFKKLKPHLAYLCIAGSLPVLDYNDLGLYESEFIARAQKIEFVEDYVRELKVDTKSWLVRNVTLGRRASGRWNKSDRSVSNKVCNAVLNQLTLIDKWLVELSSLSVNRPEDL